MCETFLVMTHWKLNMQNSKLSLVLPVQRPFYSHSSKTSFWILLPTPERGKPANNSKYNMRRQMLQKSVWREATMLRSAEVDALLNQTILIPQFGAKCHESNQRKPSSFQSASFTMPYGIHFIRENSIHLKQKVGSAATRSPPVILIFVFKQIFFRDQSTGISIFRKFNLWHANYDKGQVHQGTLKNRSLSNSPGAGLLTPATTLNNWSTS